MPGVRELAHRESDGLTVTLSWDDVDNRVYVGLRDRKTNIQDIFEVPQERALDAFEHPYTYRDAKVVSMIDEDDGA
jgi:hypothetical protein